MEWTILLTVFALLFICCKASQYYIATHNPPEWVESVCMVTRLGFMHFFMYRPVQVFTITAVIGLLVLV